jgi:site-specific DNA-methyltransferase (adenine-specific)
MGSKSRYFNIDLWAERNGILQIAKPSKSEKNKGCEDLPNQKAGGMQGRNDGSFDGKITYNNNNNHPTVKSIALMSWLIKLVSKEGDIVLDPFAGSGTTLVASQILNRKWIGIEKEVEYVKIIKARLKPYLEQEKLV